MKKAPNMTQPLTPNPNSTGYMFQHTAKGEPLTDLYQRLHETALDIATATGKYSAFEWPDLIIYLLRSMENQVPSSNSLESALDEICRQITRRLDDGKW
jgi:hypothetical protein